jgi:hypothetical protein
VLTVKITEHVGVVQLEVVRLPKEYNDLLNLRGDQIILVDLKGKYSLWDKKNYFSALKKIAKHPKYKQEILGEFI